MTKTRGVLAQQGAALVNLLLLLCLAALVAGGWFGWQQWQLWQQDAERQAQKVDQLQTTLAQLEEQRKQQADQLAALETRLAQNATAVDDLRAGGQRDWVVNEAAALASLAQQRLLLTADVEAADRLLAAADQVLARASQPALLNARRALARDRQALEGARQLDIAGMVLKLAALQERVSKLTATAAPRAQAAETEQVEGDWWAQLLARMPVQVRRYDKAVPLPLDESQASLLRLTLSALLEQAQLALLQGRAEVYRRALAQARQILAGWFPADHALASELDSTLSGLEEQPVEQALPDIGAGLQALKQLQGESS